MTPPEITIAALVYAATLLLGQRLLAFTVPDLLEVSFLIAAVTGSTTAAVLYYRQQYRGTERGTKWSAMLSSGGTFAILATVLGMFTQMLWQSFDVPLIAVPVAAILTAAAPLIIFPLVRLAYGERYDVTAPTPITGTHAGIVAVAALLAGAVAFVIQAPARITFKFQDVRMLGLTVALPAGWHFIEQTELIEYGIVRAEEPHGGGRVMVQWKSGDPTPPEDFAKAITGGSLEILDRGPALAGGHEGVTFYMEDPQTPANRLAITAWYCQQDHRMVSVATVLSGGKATLLAAQKRIMESVRCHTTPPGPVTFPTFVPPPGFKREDRAGVMVFTGTKGQTILFDAGAQGRSLLTQGDLPPDVVAKLVKGVASIEKLDGTPTLRTVRDLLGHERHVWSAAGSTAGGQIVQVEVMVWYCDVRDMTFIGGYATREKHPMDEGVDALLPAVCHTAK